LLPGGLVVEVNGRNTIRDTSNNNLIFLASDKSRM